jgi:putative ATP-binding cassette transporter
MVFYLKQAKDIDIALQSSTKFQGKVFDMISDIIHGFKELKINQNKNDELYKDLVSNSEKVKDIKVNAVLPIVRVTLFANIFFYMLIAIVVFVLPNLISEFSDNLPKLTAALLFIVPPLTNVGGSIPVFANSNNAIDKVYSLEKKLDKIQE